MHVAIAVGTMLLGGWVLHSPVDEGESAVAEQSVPSQSAPTPYRAERTQADGEAVPRRQAGSPGGGSPARTQQRQSSGLPLAPTEALSPDDDMFGNFMAPTNSLPPSGVSGASGSSGQMGFGSRQPSAPTGRRSYAGQSGHRPASGSMMLDQNRYAPSSGSAAVMAPPVTDKAFSGYRAPSGVSPYMNLFRTGDALGTVDNYTTLVRPEVEQRFLNQKFGHDIRGLERDTRMQGMNMQQLNREARSLQGVGTPQFYMNRGSYYPGYGQ